MDASRIINSRPLQAFNQVVKLLFLFAFISIKLFSSILLFWVNARFFTPVFEKYVVVLQAVHAKAV
jgi:hypothetical protein